MAEIVFGRQDMEELATKLSGVDDALGERQKTFGTMPVSEIVVTKPADAALPPLGDVVFDKSGAEQPHLKFEFSKRCLSRR